MAPKGTPEQTARYTTRLYGQGPPWTVRDRRGMMALPAWIAEWQQAHGILGGSDHQFVGQPCPGCADHPSPSCAACDRPAVVATLAEMQGAEPRHTFSWCARCFAVVTRGRSEAAPPLVFVPLTGGE